MGQSDTHSKGIRSVRVAKFEAVGFFYLVGKTFVTFRDQDESVLGLGVAYVFIGMELKC